VSYISWAGSVIHDYSLWRESFSGKNDNIKLYPLPVLIGAFGMTPLIRKPADLARDMIKPHLG